MKNRFHSWSGVARAASAFSLLLAPAAVTHAQTTSTTTTSTVSETITAVPFPVEIGRATSKPNPRLTVNYAVLATDAITSKAVSQKLRFTIQEDGLREVLSPTGEITQREGSSSRYMTVNTGKYKNLGQLKTQIAGMFQRFLAGGLPPNTDLGKIGDARYGGEIHFVAAGPDLLRCDYLPDTAHDGGFQFKRRDVNALLAILTGEAA